MFSVGSIFHLLLFGKPLFKATKNDEMVKENRQCEITFSENYYESIPHETLDLLQKMLRKDPEERINAEQALAHPFFKQIP